MAQSADLFQIVGLLGAEALAQMKVDGVKLEFVDKADEGFQIHEAAGVVGVG